MSDQKPHTIRVTFTGGGQFLLPSVGRPMLRGQVKLLRKSQERGGNFEVTASDGRLLARGVVARFEVV